MDDSLNRLTLKKLMLRGEIDVNCYVIARGGTCLVVDPGYERERIVSYVRDNGLDPVGILLTHAHTDHIGAADCFPVPVYLHERETEILFDNFKNGFEYFGKTAPFSLEALDIVTVTSSTVIDLSGEAISVIHTPGHTPGCVCYRAGADLITGDTLFKGGVGRWDFPTGDLSALKKSVVSLIDSQEDSIRIHPGHGHDSTIGSERRSNSYYREWESELRS